MPEPLRVNIEFEEHEARLLAYICDAVADHLTEQQEKIVGNIAGKFVFAAGLVKDELVRDHGRERANEIADELLNEYPDDEMVVVIPNA